MDVGEDKKKAPRIVRGAGMVYLRAVPGSGRTGRFDLLGGRHGIKNARGLCRPPGRWAEPTVCLSKNTALKADRRESFSKWR